MAQQTLLLTDLQSKLKLLCVLKHTYGVPEMQQADLHNNVQEAELMH